MFIHKINSTTKNKLTIVQKSHVRFPWDFLDTVISQIITIIVMEILKSDHKKVFQQPWS